MPYLNSLPKYIGKIAATLSLFFASTLTAQNFLLQDSLTSVWPKFLLGDTSKFTITQYGIQSKSEILTPHSYQLYFDTPLISDSIICEFTVQLNLNTSSLNRFQFGFLFEDSLDRLFSMGNAKDEWEYLAPEINENFGNTQYLNTSKSKFTIQLQIIDKHCYIHILPHDNSKPVLLYQVPITKKVRGFQWRISQNGKSAIGTHLISQLLFSKYPAPIKNTLKRLRILSDSSLLLEFKHPIVFPKDTCIQSTLSSLKPTKLENLNRTLLLQFNKQSITDTFTIHLKRIQDNYGTFLDTQINCIYEFPKSPMFGSVVFTEIMYDALPVYSKLPGIEYIEIQNLGNQKLQLKDCSLIINGKNYTFPDYSLTADATVLITSDTAVFNAPFKLEIPFNLLNQENTIILRTPQGDLLDSVYLYNKQQLPYLWDGGWSIALANPQAPLNPPWLWKSHKQPMAGSPGFKNPKDTFADQHSQLFVSAIFSQSDLFVEFSEPIKPQQWIHINNDSVYYNTGTLIKVEYHTLNKDSAYFSFVSRFQEKVSVTIPIFCEGYSFLELSEIWFEAPFDSDYVEIHNSGKNAVKLEDLDLLIYDSDPSILKHIVPLVGASKKWLCPNELIVITENPYYLYQRFIESHTHLILKVPPFPNLSSSGGSVEIVNHRHGRLDRANFNREMHVNSAFHSHSLEKRAPGLLSQFNQNWNSYLSLTNPCSPAVWHKPVTNQPSKTPLFMERRRWLIGNQSLKIPLYFDFPNSGFQLYAYVYDGWGNPLGPIIQGHPFPQKGVYYIQLEDFPFMVHNGNFVIKFEAQHVPTQQYLRYVQRVSFIYE